jgi:membrane protein YqaA with SNARE-associated domain
LDAIINHLYHILMRMGGFGLLALGIFDSSFLFMPLGNDLLMVAMTARRHGLLFYYAAMATAGSVLGCLLMDVVSRKGGEAGLEKRLPRKRLEYVKAKVEKKAGWALATAALLPPPFPFTPFVIAAAALKYPRKKLLGIIAIARFVRFTIAGVLAVLFGRRIIALAKMPAVQYAILALVAISIVGSALSIYSWYQRSKSSAGRMDATPRAVSG